MDFTKMSPEEIQSAFTTLENTNFAQAEKIEALEGENASLKSHIETLNTVIGNAKSGAEGAVGKVFEIGGKKYLARRSRVQFGGENKLYQIEDVVKDEALLKKLFAIKGQKILIEQ